MWLQKDMAIFFTRSGDLGDPECVCIAVFKIKT